ncbi:MAG TPA: NADP-dependent malic enzyme [Candidatus Nanoarchaeia archaeon]|nr:NADP-dependent malic enzyme [Candidatus Nanoarchaeia archaeon]
MGIKEDALELHKNLKGKISIKTKTKVTAENLKLVYTPGVSHPCLEIAKNKELTYEYTNKWNNVAVVSDGTRVLGLGNIGPYAAMPVMEGKALLFKEFGNVDAFPICINTKDPEEIIKAVKNIEPSFGGINLEDIEAPKCFYIYRELKKSLDIPVFHDDQDGTATVVLAGLINALKILNKKFKDIKITILGTGAAGIAIANLLLDYRVENIDIFDSQGLVYKGRNNGMNEYKEEIANRVNATRDKNLNESLTGCDVLIGVSGKANSITKEEIKIMNENAIVFALTNPDPEINYKEAKEGGARICASGGAGNYPNQVNNMLVFPSIFRGALDAGAKTINKEMIIAAAEEIAKFVKEEELNENHILPLATEKGLFKKIAREVKKAAKKSKAARI